MAEKKEAKSAPIPSNKMVRFRARTPISTGLELWEADPVDFKGNYTGEPRTMSADTARVFGPLIDLVD